VLGTNQLASTGKRVDIDAFLASGQWEATSSGDAMHPQGMGMIMQPPRVLPRLLQNISSPVRSEPPPV
jgi:hypothetical protein